MKRRSLLKATSLFGLTGLIPFLPAKAASGSLLSGDRGDLPAPGKYGFRRFPLGDLEITIVSDGNLIMDPVQPFFAPDIAPEKVKALLEESFRPTDHIELGINILVIKKPGKLIIVDTGMGINAGEPGEKGITNGMMMQNLQTAGFAPGDFTDVVISHAHPDHIGGVTTKDGGLAFPNAKIHLSKTEFDFWTSDKPDFSKSRLAPEMVQPIATATKATLKKLQSSLVFYAPGNRLLDCLWMEAAPGHTPGHSLTHIYSGKEEMVHIADLVHSDVLLFPHPEWGFFGDTDFKMGAETRRKVMGTLAASRTKVFAYHLSWPGVGFIRKKGDGFEWVPETYASAAMS